MLQDSPKTGTGDLLVSVQAIEPIVVPFPSDNTKEEIESLVDRILAAKKANPKADTTAEEREIPSTCSGQALPLSMTSMA